MLPLTNKFYPVPIQGNRSSLDWDSAQSVAHLSNWVKSWFSELLMPLRLYDWVVNVSLSWQKVQAQFLGQMGLTPPSILSGQNEEQLVYSRWLTAIKDCIVVGPKSFPLEESMQMAGKAEWCHKYAWAWWFETAWTQWKKTPQYLNYY